MSPDLPKYSRDEEWAAVTDAAKDSKQSIKKKGRSG